MKNVSFPLWKHTLSFALLIYILSSSPAFAANRTDYSASSTNAQEQILFSLINEDRARYGLSPFVLDSELCRAARVKSRDMVDNNYFDHTSPTYGSVKPMLKALGIPVSYASENIARSRNVYQAHASFLSSESHRRMVLSANYTHIGVGVVHHPSGHVVVTEIFTRK